MSLRAFNLRAAAMTILLVTSTAIAGPIESRISVLNLTLPQSLEANSSSWCTWTYCSIGPRLYLAPRSDGSLLIGWTDNFGNGHVSTVSGSSIAATYDFAGNRVRGLVAHSDGSYAVLLKNGATLSLSKRTADGSPIWTTNLNSTIAEDSSSLGGHRLVYGGGIYAAYWAVHGISGNYAGHEGDQLTLSTIRGRSRTVGGVGVARTRWPSSLANTQTMPVSHRSARPTATRTLMD